MYIRFGHEVHTHNKVKIFGALNKMQPLNGLLN